MQMNAVNVNLNGANPMSYGGFLSSISDVILANGRRLGIIGL